MEIARACELRQIKFDCQESGYDMKTRNPQVMTEKEPQKHRLEFLSRVIPLIL